MAQKWPVGKQGVNDKARKWVIQLLMSITASIHGEIQQYDTNRTSFVRDYRGTRYPYDKNRIRHTGLLDQITTNNSYVTKYERNVIESY